MALKWISRFRRSSLCCGRQFTNFFISSGFKEFKLILSFSFISFSSFVIFFTVKIFHIRRNLGFEKVLVWYGRLWIWVWAYLIFEYDHLLLVYKFGHLNSKCVSNHFSFQIFQRALSLGHIRYWTNRRGFLD